MNSRDEVTNLLNKISATGAGLAKDLLEVLKGISPSEVPEPLRGMLRTWPERLLLIKNAAYATLDLVEKEKAPVQPDFK
jgi:hypothetical protein